jgi:L-ascorbate metabolism protein UlaG (beta-lactamase superfamily)
MKRSIIILMILIFSANANRIFSQNDKEVNITYVGNSGFLITIGDKKILIDALFKGFAGDYILPEQIQEKLKNAQAPFDDVDLILATHTHGDHIDLGMVNEHMKNNPKAIFASTKQLVNHMKDSSGRSIAFNPSKEKSDKKDIKDIGIEAFYLPHGPDLRIINNGFLVSVDGVKFFHTGDVDFDQFTFEEFRSLQLPEKKIDLSFIQHFYLTNDSASKLFVTKGIGGKYILPIHYHFTTPSFDAAIVKENYPDAILFDKELESWKMPAKGNDFTIQKGYYYDQDLPGDSAVIFAPGIFSLPDRLERSIAFSPDGKECYFGVVEIKDNKASYNIYYTNYKNNKWTEQLEVPFSVKNNVSNPFVSADGERLYFVKNGSIWKTQCSPKKWRKAQKLPSPINSVSHEDSYMETADGVVYVSSKRPGGFGGIDNWRISRLPDQSLKAENLGRNMNLGSFDFDPFVAPDGSYLIFGSDRYGRRGRAHLYICFNKGNNEWTAPINMNSCGAKINIETAQHSSPSLSPDGKFLFFMRHKSMMDMDVYWVSTKIIEKLKTKSMRE